VPLCPTKIPVVGAERQELFLTAIPLLSHATLLLCVPLTAARSLVTAYYSVCSLATSTVPVTWLAVSVDSAAPHGPCYSACEYQCPVRWQHSSCQAQRTSEVQ